MRAKSWLSTKGRRHEGAPRSSKALADAASLGGDHGVVAGAAQVAGTAYCHAPHANRLCFLHCHLHGLWTNMDPQSLVCIQHRGRRCLTHHSHIWGWVVRPVLEPGDVLPQHVAHPVALVAPQIVGDQHISHGGGAGGSHADALQ